MSKADADKIARTDLDRLQQAARRMLNRRNGGTSCSRVS